MLGACKQQLPHLHLKGKTSLGLQETYRLFQTWTIPKNSEIFSFTFFPLTPNSSSYSRKTCRLRSFLWVLFQMEEWIERQSLKYVMGGESFEKALMLSHSLLEGSQVVCLQVLLHLSQVLVQDITQSIQSFYFWKLFPASPGLSLSHPGQPLLCGLEVWSGWPAKKAIKSMGRRLGGPPLVPPIWWIIFEYIMCTS